jgi:starch synthase
MYGLRYGTVPLVRRVGGLADTVHDGITGVVFDAATAEAFQAAVRRAQALRNTPAAWQTLMRRGMVQDLSWAGPAREYLALYAEAREARAESPRWGA